MRYMRYGYARRLTTSDSPDVSAVCGVGTLPLEAAATCPMVVTLAGDADAELLVQARLRPMMTDD